MKKRLSLVPTLIIGLAVFFVLGAIAVWLEETFGLPDWTVPIFILITVGAFLEVVSRIGPKEFDAPITQLLKLSGRDKVVLLIASLAAFIIFPLGKSFNSGWINLLFLVLGLLAFWFICFFFGSKELMRSNTKRAG